MPPSTQTSNSATHVWGVRDVDDIVREAMPNGLALREVVEMPANNLSLVLVKSSCRSDPALRERFAGN
jgi:hypothetical protein